MRGGVSGFLAAFGCASAILGTATAALPQGAPSLASLWPAPVLREVLAAREDWRPIPAITRRDAWAALAPRLRERLVKR